MRENSSCTRSYFFRGIPFCLWKGRFGVFLLNLYATFNPLFQSLHSTGWPWWFNTTFCWLGLFPFLPNSALVGESWAEMVWANWQTGRTPESKSTKSSLKPPWSPCRILSCPTRVYSRIMACKCTSGQNCILPLPSSSSFSSCVLYTWT